jgi:hypothetical protein
LLLAQHIFVSSQFFDNKNEEQNVDSPKKLFGENKNEEQNGDRSHTLL